MTVEGENDDISGVGQTAGRACAVHEHSRGSQGPLAAARRRALRRVQRLAFPRRDRAAHRRLRAVEQRRAATATDKPRMAPATPPTAPRHAARPLGSRPRRRRNLSLLTGIILTRTAKADSRPFRAPAMVEPIDDSALPRTGSSRRACRAHWPRWRIPPGTLSRAPRRCGRCSIAGRASRRRSRSSSTVRSIPCASAATARRGAIRCASTPPSREVVLTMPPRGSLREARDFAQKHGGWIAARCSGCRRRRRSRTERSCRSAACRTAIVHRPQVRGTGMDRSRRRRRAA